MKQEDPNAENTENQGDACDAAQEHAGEAAEEQLADEEEGGAEENTAEPPKAADVDAAGNDESIAGPQGGHSTTAPEADKDGMHWSFDSRFGCCCRYTERPLPPRPRQLHPKAFLRGRRIEHGASLTCSCAMKESVAWWCS